MTFTAPNESNPKEASSQIRFRWGGDPQPGLRALKPARRSLPLALVAVPGVGSLIASLFVADQAIKLAALAFGAAVVVFAIFAAILRVPHARKQSFATLALVSLVINDASPRFFSRF